MRCFKKGLTDYLRDQDIVYNYEAALSLDHSDRDGNDISLDSSDNDMDMDIQV